jgi:23S rRNA (adenine-N6)-dimethyltransferase
VAGHSRAWGWYRLEPTRAERLVRDAGIRPGDLVLDIGAGDGALTAPLLQAGAHVIAIELHPGRAATLRRRFAHAHVRVVQVDATDLRLPRRPFRVVANPPWAITTPLVRRLVHPGSRLERADLIVDRAAARRWAAGAPASHRLAVAATVPRSAFRPNAPAVAAVLRIERAATKPFRQDERPRGPGRRR